MGMMIEEIIAKETEEAKWFQRVANEDILSEQYYEELKIFREKQVDYHNQIANILCKYQKITEIVKSWRENGLDYDSCDAMENIERVVENGKID